MTNLSMLANIAEIIGVLIVIGGLFFAILQMRQIRQQRRELAALELFRFFGSPKFAQAYRQILHMQGDLTANEVREGDNNLEDSAMLICTTMENIGVMTHQRIVPFKIVNNLIGASTGILWKKLESWIVGVREELDDPAAFEWFQWLAERLADYQEDRGPAYQSETDWKPAHTQQQF